jgi:predicted metal-dependent hydrolase
MNKTMIYTIGEHNIPLTISESKKSKCIRLLVDMNGFKVVKPERASSGEIRTFLNDNRKWIVKHYIKFLELRKSIEHAKRKSKGKILFKGSQYDLLINLHDKKRSVISFEQDKLCISINGYNEGMKKDRKELISETESLLKKWYIEQARELLTERAKYYSSITGFNFSRIAIRDQKTRWGSCSAKGNLNFNWRLVMAPSWVSDYVVVHEICHLKRMDHSKAFWQMVEKYMPHYKEAKKWLKVNGLMLMYNHLNLQEY